MMISTNLTSYTITALCLVMAALFYNLGYMVHPDAGVIVQGFYESNDLKEVSLFLYFVSGACILIGFAALFSATRKEKTKIINSSLLLLMLATASGWWFFSSFFYAVAQ